MVVTCLLLGLLASLSYGFIVHSASVSRELSRQIQRGPGTTIDFAEVAPFAWDRVYVFGPYTPPAQIHTSLGFQWDGISRTSIELNDGVNLVVFVRGTEVVYWLEHSRKEELGWLANSGGYAREQARFSVSQDGPGERLALTRQK